MQLNDMTLLRQQALIDGQWCDVPNGGVIAVTNPANGEQLGSVPEMDADETREAIKAANRALPAWCALAAKERTNILRRWFDLMMENQDDLTRLMTLEQGRPLAEAKGEISYAASFIEWFAEEGKRIYGSTISGHQADKRLLVIKQPIGVTATITPWNFPAAMITRKAGPALAAGCTMVLKPASQTSPSALALAELANRAGVPAGVFNVIAGSAGAVGGELTSNPLVHKLSLTDSTEIGRQLTEQYARGIKKISPELGGNAPFIVFDDVDLNKAVEGVLALKFRNAGQTCVRTNQLYVQDGVYDRSAEKLQQAVEKLRIGDGLQDGVTAGPLIDEKAVTKVEKHIADAIAKGAKIVTDSKPHALSGNFLQPTILVNIPDSTKVAKKETFGPLAPLLHFKDEADVIVQANDIEFGFATYFYARDPSRVSRIGEALGHGIIGISTGVISTEVAPFGGVKASDLDREGSKCGIENYLEIKYMCIGLQQKRWMNGNRAMMARHSDAVPRGVDQIHPIFAERTENYRVWNIEGRGYLDFADGIAVLNTGHLHPQVVAVIEDQPKKLSHTCFQVLAYEPYLALCEKMNQKVPGDFARKTLLVTTGSEAVENVMKIARAATGRSGAIAFTGVYHGRTHYILSLTGKANPYSAGMGLMPGHIYHALYPCALHGVSDDEAIANIHRIFKNDAVLKDIAAIIIEPVQGEDGFYAASPVFMQRLRALCDEHGIMLIADEIQSGVDCTGTLFAMEQMGVAADITTFAKSIAGGFPLAGVAERTEMMDVIAPGGLGGTYAGNPIVCTAALAVLQIFERENLLEEANQLGDTLRQGLLVIAEDHPETGDVRSLGAMIAIELFEEGDRSKPNARLTADIVARARDKGLILLSCGPYYNVLCILVPLTIEETQIGQGLKIIADCFTEAKQAQNSTHTEVKYVRKGMKTKPAK